MAKKRPETPEKNHISIATDGLDVAPVVALERNRNQTQEHPFPSPLNDLPLLLSHDVVGRFREKMDRARAQKKAIALLCHDHPDPDSFGPAFALRTFFESLGIEAEIFHGGEVSHPENRAAQNILAIDMTDSETLRARAQEFSSIILMDAGATGGLNVRSTNVQPDVVIDHHDDENAPPKALVIRRRVGSVCTIVTHLLYSMRFNFEDYPRAATALYLGLQTDTAGLTSELVTPYDIAAHSLLVQFYDQSAYRRILRYVLPESLLRLKAMAYGPNFFRQGPLVVTGVGYVESSGKDMLAIIADEILRVEGITKVVVLGILKGDKPALVASVRTSVDTLNTHGFVKEIFGASHAGAKQGAGGAYVEVGPDLGAVIHQALADGNADSIFHPLLKVYREKILRYPG
jgi:nanoRNase/pAp phosphatase (c-di-AMP/oligoRNAs hydrolase)